MIVSEMGHSEPATPQVQVLTDSRRLFGIQKKGCSSIYDYSKPGNQSLASSIAMDGHTCNVGHSLWEIDRIRWLIPPVPDKQL